MAKIFDRESPFKDTFNTKMVQMIRNQPIEPSNIKALILDSERMRTTEYLTLLGVKKENITSIESDEHVHQVHLDNGINSIHTKFEDYTKQLKYQKTQPYHLLVMDLCGCVPNFSKPLLTLFQKNMIGDDTMLIITFSQRHHVRGKSFKYVYTKMFEKRRQILEKKLRLKCQQFDEYAYGGSASQSAMYSEFLIYSKS